MTVSVYHGKIESLIWLCFVDFWTCISRQQTMQKKFSRISNTVVYYMLVLCNKDARINSTFTRARVLSKYLHIGFHSGCKTIECKKAKRRIDSRRYSNIVLKLYLYWILYWVFCVTTSSSDSLLTDFTLGVTRPRLGEQGRKRNKKSRTLSQLSRNNHSRFRVGTTFIFLLSARNILAKMHQKPEANV